MNKSWAIVNKLLPFSCVDGPGNRFVVFFQGCNFRCLNCHNPYTIGLCHHCGDCVPTCPAPALSLNAGKVIWQADQCQQCDTCISQCDYSSTPMTLRYNVDDLMQQLTKYRLFLNGITTSGGESTLQLPFIKALFSQIKNDPTLQHLSCFIDSNGHLPISGWQSVLNVMDGAMIDLKAWDSSVHKRLTGRDNLRVKQSIEFLAQHNKLHEVRLLLIPEQTDLVTHAEEIALFLRALDSNLQIRINAFQPHGVIGAAKDWPATSQQQVASFAAQLKSYGLTNLLLPAVYLA